MKYTTEIENTQVIEFSGSAEEQPEGRSKKTGVIEQNSVIPVSICGPTNALTEKLALELTSGRPDSSSQALLDNRKQVISSEAFDNVSDRKRASVTLSGRISRFDGRRAERMKGCCSVVSRITVKSRTNGQERYEFHPTVTCKDRLCPYCSRSRSAKLSNRLSDPLRQLQSNRQLHASFLTLTFRNTDELRTFEELTKARKKLLKGKFLKQYGIVGSIGAIEVKLGKDSKKWHSHFHLVVFTEKEIPTENGKWTIEANQILADEWYAITGDSFILRGMAFDGNYKEILKYISKGVEKMTDEQLKDFCQWSKGRRFLFTTGELYNNKELKALIKQAETEEEGLELSEDEEITEVVMMHYKPSLNNYVVVSVQNYGQEIRTG